MPDRINRYEIGGRLASGGMAEIFAARAVAEPGIAKRVALKKILAGFCADPAFVARFLDEARLAMRLSHANIVQVFDFGKTDQDQYFLAMEFVEGVDLKRLLLARPGAPLPLGEALHVAAQTLRGLDYAHRQSDDHGQPLGVVHRDVKPANVLVSLEGEVKLTDFGIARSRSGSQMSAAGDICGTIPFMSPEQARGLRVDCRSDVFSVGTMLYTMATGLHPFEAESDFATLDKVRAAALEPPSRHGLPESFDELLLRALAQDPAARFATASAFAEAIEEYAYANGLRGGAATLARHLGEVFPGERERLAGLFAAGARSEQLAVARPGSTGGYTQLSHIAAAAPSHRTVAVTVAPRSRRTVAALGIGAALFLAAGAAIALLWPRPPALPPPQRGLMAELGKGIVGGELPGARAARAAARAATQPATGPATTPASAPLAAKAPPRRPAVAGEGHLTVNAQPWGAVFLNGRKVKESTPLVEHKVRAGWLTVTVENPKLGRRERRVQVKPGEKQLVTFDLRGPIK
ncbi:MAG TPA: serine/threonine-protein kinase [Polyangia bacterium]|jgi:tRNA A-37 threonylcarbamoyl transferase component Bud32